MYVDAGSVITSDGTAAGLDACLHLWRQEYGAAAADASCGEELLETTQRPVDWIAGEVGFGNAATLRHHFTRARSVSPQQYRRTFCAIG